MKPRRKTEPPALAKRVTRIVRRVLFPGPAVTVVSVVAGGTLLVVTFTMLGDDHPVAYVAYVVSAYALVVVCANAVPLARRVQEWMRRNTYARRLQDDITYRMRVSLYGSLAINLLYAVANVLSGLLHHSIWSGTLAAYYILLSLMRVSLARHAITRGFGKDRSGEYRRYWLCGVSLVVMTAALIGVIVLVLHGVSTFAYGGVLIYVMAMYAFYSMIMAVVNIVRYRRFNSPVIAAISHVNLVCALVSMLALEIAMLTQFGGGDSPYFRPLMIGITGAVVCACVMTQGVYMTVHATIQLRRLRR